MGREAEESIFYVPCLFRSVTRSQKEHVSLSTGPASCVQRVCACVSRRSRTSSDEGPASVTFASYTASRIYGAPLAEHSRCLDPDVDQYRRPARARTNRTASRDGRGCGVILGDVTRRPARSITRKSTCSATRRGVCGFTTDPACLVADDVRG